MSLYESRTPNDGMTMRSPTNQREALFAAALKDFPLNVVSPRRATVRLPT
jgi:hypothetical protein